MSWEDRLREAAYESPGGTRLTFQYEDVEQVIEKKGTAFNFPDVDGTYVQDLGHTERKFPMRIFFWGTDYDQDAEFFLSELLQGRGAGRLEHPIYGVRDVVPFGPIVRRDRLKTAANQAVFEITFWETTGIIWPTSEDDPASEVVAAVDEFNTAAAETFESNTDIDTTVEQAELKGKFQVLLDNTVLGLQGVADIQANVERQFNAVRDSINNSISDLIGQPLTLAFQTSILIQAPARANTLIEARLDAYRSLLDSLTVGENVIALPGFDSSNANAFHANDLFSSSYVSASVLSVINNQFQTKTAALNAAERLLSQLDQLTAWRDDNFESLGQIDTGESYQQLLEAVGLAAGFLVQISFTLKQERIIELARDRTIIDLVAELYGSVDDQLEFFISSNDLTGSEILELPRGKRVVYYV